MSEIEKALAELKALMKYRSEQLGRQEEFRGLGLTSRKNLCLHPSIKREKSGSVVDARCRSVTAGFVKEKRERGEDVELCIYHEVSLALSLDVIHQLSVRTLTCLNHTTLFHQAFGHLMVCFSMAKSKSNAHTLRHGEW